MRAVDTNIIVRFLTRDDPKQAAIADQIFRTDVFIPLTVVLETGWLLKSSYGYSRSQVAASLRALFDMPEVTIAEGEIVQWAIDRLAVVGDLGDLLHLVASKEAEAFVTFDRALARDAGSDAPVTIETLKS